MVFYLALSNQIRSSRLTSTALSTIRSINSVISQRNTKHESPVSSLQSPVSTPGHLATKNETRNTPFVIFSKAKRLHLDLLRLRSARDARSAVTINTSLESPVSTPGHLATKNETRNTPFVISLRNTPFVILPEAKRLFITQFKVPELLPR